MAQIDRMTVVIDGETAKLRAALGDGQKAVDEFAAKSGKAAKQYDGDMAKIEASAKKAGAGVAALGAGADTSRLRAELQRGMGSIAEFERQTARNTRNIDAHLSRFGKVGVSIGQGLRNIAAGAAAGFGAYQLYDWYKQGREAMDALQDLSDVTGLSIAKLQELKYAAVEGGVPFEQFQAGLKRFTVAMGEVDRGAGSLRDKVKPFDISLFGKLQAAQDQAERVNLIADAIKALGTEEEKTALTTAFFGRKAADMVRIFSAGSDGLAKSAQAARQMGQILTEAEIRQGAELQEAAEKAEARWSVLWQKIVAKSGPVVTGLMEANDKAAAEQARRFEEYERRHKVTEDALARGYGNVAGAFRGAWDDFWGNWDANTASGLQRWESGVEAMRQRLAKVDEEAAVLRRDLGGVGDALQGGGVVEWLEKLADAKRRLVAELRAEGYAERSPAAFEVFGQEREIGRIEEVVRRRKMAAEELEQNEKTLAAAKQKRADEEEARTEAIFRAWLRTAEGMRQSMAAIAAMEFPAPSPNDIAAMAAARKELEAWGQAATGGGKKRRKIYDDAGEEAAAAKMEELHIRMLESSGRMFEALRAQYDRDVKDFSKALEDKADAASRLKTAQDELSIIMAKRLSDAERDGAMQVLNDKAAELSARHRTIDAINMEADAAKRAAEIEAETSLDPKAREHLETRLALIQSTAAARVRDITYQGEADIMQLRQQTAQQLAKSLGDQVRATEAASELELREWRHKLEQQLISQAQFEEARALLAKQASDKIKDVYLKEINRVADVISSSLGNAFDNWIETGKLSFNDLMREMIAGTAKLAMRMAVLEPLFGGGANQKGGLFQDLIYSAVHHGGGEVGGPAPARLVPAAIFATAARRHSGNLRPGEMPIIAEIGEGIISKRNMAELRNGARGGSGAGQAGQPVVINISTPDVAGFRASQSQVAASIHRVVNAGRRNL